MSSTTATCPLRKTLCNRVVTTKTALEVEIYNSIEAVNSVEWNTLLPEDNHLLRTPYLLAAEKANPHIQFRYAKIFDKDELVAVMLFQLINVNNGLRIQPAQNAKERMVNGIKKFINGLDISLLLCGNAFITGDFGFSLKKTTDSSVFVEGLGKVIEEIRKETRVNIVMVKDFRPENIEMGRLLTQYNFKEVGAQPNMEFTIRDNWHTFDDYLKDMTSKYRTKVKSKVKKLKGIESHELSVEEMHQHYQKVFELYSNCSDNAEFNLTTLTPEYFLSCKEQLPESFHIRGYFLEGKLVGFLSYFDIKGEMESHFVGYEPDINRQYALYHNLVIDHIRVAIEKKHSGISYGRTSLESKSNLGAVGVDLNSFVWSSNFFLQTFAHQIFDNMVGDDFIPRHPFKEEVA